MKKKPFMPSISIDFQDVVDFVNEHDPEDFFSKSDLENWAKKNGWMKIKVYVS